MNENQKKRLREFANTYGSGSSKVLNESTEEQIAWFKSQHAKVKTWLKNISTKLDDLTAQQLFIKLTPEQRAALLRKMK